MTETNANSDSGPLCHLLDEDFNRLFDEGLQRTEMKNHPWLRPRFFQMIQMLKLTWGLPGATADAGVYRGLSSFLICNYLRREREKAGQKFNGDRHFMVDSWEGLSQPVDSDGEHAQGRWSQKAFTDTSLERVQKLMKDFGSVTYAKGWIPLIFDTLPEQKYRFVHIDVDIFEPTLDSLRYFYPRMVVGGMIVIDDYGPWSNRKWPGCRKAVMQFSEESKVPHVSLDTGNGVIIKR